MSYRDNVRAAAAALSAGEEANWELARLTFENTWDGSGPLGLKQPGKVSMDQWCTDVRQASGRRFSVGTGRKYKTIWRRYGSLSPGERELTWYEAYENIQGGNETRDQRLAHANISQGLEYGTPEVKREAFARLSQDRDVVSDQATTQQVFEQIVRDNPAVVQEAWKDTDTNIRLSTARVDAREELLEPMRREAEENKKLFQPTGSTLDNTKFLHDVETKVELWTRHLESIVDFLESSTDVNVITRWSLRQSFERLVRVATQCRDLLPASYAEPDDEGVVEGGYRKPRGRLRSAS